MPSFEHINLEGEGTALEGPPAPSDSTISSDRVEALKQARAQEQLNRMGFQSWQDMIQEMEGLYQAKLRQLDRVIDRLTERLDTVTTQLVEIRNLSLQDAERTFAVMKVVQDYVIVETKVEADSQSIPAKIKDRLSASR